MLVDKKRLFDADMSAVDLHSSELTYLSLADQQFHTKPMDERQKI